MAVTRWEMPLVIEIDSYSFFVVVNLFNGSGFGCVEAVEDIEEEKFNLDDIKLD